ncbi:MAG: hypothetical protein Q8Q35_04350 [Nanoarchaeota archaeon]|nr:hypothetical protein [Nanoarchaeota archaeon]
MKKRNLRFLFLVLIVILSLVFIRNVLFQGELDDGVSIFEIDREKGLVLDPYLKLFDFSKGLNMNNLILASEYGENKLIENTTFYPGDQIYFIMQGVSGVSIQNDGYSWYDVDISIFQDDGTVVLNKVNALGEDGKLYLQANVISPYGTIDVPQGASPGNYTLYLSLYDVYTNESVEENVGFELLNPYANIDLPSPVFAQ